jgi:hypothetical protein
MPVQLPRDAPLMYSAEEGQGRDRNAERGRPAVLEHLDPATLPTSLMRDYRVVFACPRDRSGSLLNRDD